MPAPAPGRIAALISRVTGDREGVPTSLRELRESETAKAVMLAGAMIANNLIALISTVVFSRLLTDYGSLAALISYFLILSVAGQALQVATAREGVLGHLGVGAGLAATVRRWTINLAVVTAVVTVISVLARAPIAAALDVKHDQWAAAVGLPAAVLWLELSILRGVLQSVGDYEGVGISLIGEQGARLITGALLAATALGVTGAYLGTPLSFIAMGAFCMIRLRRHVEAVTAAEPTGAVTQAPPRTRPVDPRQAGVGADRRADRDRGAPEHRHHRRQAPFHDLGRELIRRDRGRRQGPDLDRDRRRLLPRAGGHPAARGRPGLAPDPVPRARDRRASARSRCC